MLAAVPTPRISLGRFTGTDDTVRKMIEYALGPEGEQNYVVRRTAEGIIRHVAPKDYMSEILAIRAWATSPLIRYTNDAKHVEMVKTPLRCIMEMQANGSALLDCDDIGTLIAALGMSTGKAADFVVVGFEEPGKFTHVFARLREPKSGAWIVCDPVAGPKERSMLRRVLTFKRISIEGPS